MNPPSWVYLPARATALNLATVTHIEFDPTGATVFFGYCVTGGLEDLSTQEPACLPLGSHDTAVLRAALGLPTA